ncbi:SMAD/FHA domain-containing protein [Gymnopus androsaceus JB14]|uniref:SMAD/FHA domain-containing protein n=1 Tax=Gymnopus androsaceus JB14 TaxID=1447944 RepID=A0A6A4H738_9AGAR|nr:SMAD/FHA domain-containing protein [Gymnopus androsaceus JB14]
MDTNTPSAESPQLRSTILGSFLRGRPRNSSQSAPTPPIPTPAEFPAALRQLQREASPVAVTGNASSPSPDPVATSPSAPGGGLGFSMLRRRRSAGPVSQPPSVVPPPAVPNSNSNNPFINHAHAAPHPAPTAPPGTHRIRLVPHLESRRSLKFEAITRDLAPSSPALRIGRFTDRSGLGVSAVNALGSNKLAFRSKVVSRSHAEIWVEGSGASVKFFIKDTKSSSGTFLNHIRLSPAGTESRPHQVRDGDILQLGVDYQGGSEDIYKSVKIRIELGREWQSGANKFNTNAIKNLKALAQAVTVTPGAPNAKSTGKSILPDCCICLFTITIRQALFISPCSHTFHYKCIRPLIDSHFPGFSCPLCRTFADLEEDVEVEADLDAFEEIGDEGDDVQRDDGGDGDRELPTPIGDEPSSGGAGVGVDEDEDHDVDSAFEEVAQTLQQRQIREAQRERERDVGAETDVELPVDPSGSGTGGRPRRSGHGRHLSAQMDPMELILDQEEADDDVDMVDADAEAMGMDEDFEDDVGFVDPDGEGDGLEGGSGSEEIGVVHGGPAGAKRKR